MRDNEKKWNGFCGAHCLHRRFCPGLTKIIITPSITVCVYKDRNVGIGDGDICNIPPTGPWNFNMDEAPRDGTNLLLLVEFGAIKGNWTMRFGWYHQNMHEWHLQGWGGIGGLEPVAFAVINRPWKGPEE